jgi:hypothetical protein
VATTTPDGDGGGGAAAAGVGRVAIRELERSVAAAFGPFKERLQLLVRTVAEAGMQATGNEPSAKLLWLKRRFAKFEGELGGLRRSELRALEMKVGMMEENEILARQMAAAAAAHAARDEALERRLAEAEAALEKFQLAAAEAQAEAQWVAIASSPEAEAAFARAEAAASSTAGGDAAPEAEPEAEPLTPDPAQLLEAPGASTETGAAAAAAPAACAPEGSTGGAASRPRDHEDESPNKIPLKKQLVEHGDTAQHLTFIDAAAAAPAAAAAAPAAAE